MTKTQEYGRFWCLKKFEILCHDLSIFQKSLKNGCFFGPLSRDFTFEKISKKYPVIIIILIKIAKNDIFHPIFSDKFKFLSTFSQKTAFVEGRTEFVKVKKIWGIFFFYSSSIKLMMPLIFKNVHQKCFFSSIKNQEQESIFFHENYNKNCVTLHFSLQLYRKKIAKNLNR